MNLDFNSIKIKHSESDFKIANDFKDFEYIPLDKNIDTYLKNEVLHYTPNAKPDKKSIKTGYSINFIEKFHTSTGHRDLDSIIKDIEKLESKTLGLLNNVLK